LHGLDPLAITVYLW
jgi:hypothetical protein